MKIVRLAPFFGSLALVAGFSRAARAAEPEVCSVAYARGQEERLAGRLFNARAAFQQCANAGCSTSLASDCSRWASEVEADLPTIRVAIRDQHGAVVKNSKLFIDDSLTPLAALNAPIVLEAGPHELRVEAPGYQPVRLETALRPSDREVPVAVTLQPPRAASRDPNTDRVPTATWVLAGIGTAALGGSIYFGIRANNEYHDLKQRCAPACEPSASDGMYTKAVIFDVALASSVAAFAASAIVYFTRSTKPSAAALSVAPVPNGGRVHLVLSF